MPIFCAFWNVKIWLYFEPIFSLEICITPVQFWMLLFCFACFCMCGLFNITVRTSWDSEPQFLCGEEGKKINQNLPLTCNDSAFVFQRFNWYCSFCVACLLLYCLVTATSIWPSVLNIHILEWPICTFGKQFRWLHIKAHLILGGILKSWF